MAPEAATSRACGCAEPLSTAWRGRPAIPAADNFRPPWSATDASACSRCSPCCCDGTPVSGGLSDRLGDFVLDWIAQGSDPGNLDLDHVAVFHPERRGA